MIGIIRFKVGKYELTWATENYRTTNKYETMEAPRCRATGCLLAKTIWFLPNTDCRDRVELVIWITAGCGCGLDVCVAVRNLEELQS